MKSRILSTVILTAMLSVMPFVATAMPITYTLQNVFFDDGTQATGSFAYDAGLNLYSAANITTQIGSGGIAETFNSIFSGTNTLLFLQNSDAATGYLSRIQLIFATPLIADGGTATITPGVYSNPGVPGSAALSFNITRLTGGSAITGRIVTGGSVSSVAMTEPGTLALFALGLAGIALRKRSRAAD